MLINETSEGINQKLVFWRRILEIKGFRISRSKAKYMHCKFSQHKKSGVEVKLNGISKRECKQFRYLCSTFQNNDIIDEMF